MSAKTNRAVHEPSWTEVILGAFLSVLLGVVLAVALLILRPVVVAKEEPKERVPGAVYFIEGSRAGSTAQALAKQKAFVQGSSVTLSEGEINALIAAAKVKAPQAAAGAKKAEGDAGGYLVTGTPVVRVRDGTLQVGAPMTVDLLNQNLIAQASGRFVKEGDMFVFEPDTIYVGSCPVQDLPFVGSFVRNKFVSSQPIPEDVRAAWMKLADVSIEENTLKLTMP